MNGPEPTRFSMFSKLRAGDEQEWAKFDDSYRPWLTKLGFSRGLDSQAADELASEVIVVLYRTLPQFQYDRSKGRFRYYLATCYRNAVSNYRKEKRKKVENDSRLVELAADPEAFECLLDIIVAAEEDARKTENLEIAIAEARQVNEIQWNAWQLTESEGLSADKAAQQLDTTAGNIYTLKLRFKTRIEAIMRRLEHGTG